MKKTLSMIVVSVVFSFLILQFATLPNVLADSVYVNSVIPGVQSVNVQTPSSPNQTVNVQTSGSSGIKNPLKVNSIQDLISTALQFVVNLLAIAGVLYIIWTGFMFVKAQGNPEELKKARQSFFNAIIGMAIILGAWAIATVIANTVNKITNNNNATLGV